jgi:hypothetical protein
MAKSSFRQSQTILQYFLGVPDVQSVETSKMSGVPAKRDLQATLLAVKKHDCWNLSNRSRTEMPGTVFMNL